MNDYKKLLDFIESGWDDLTVKNALDTETHFGLPNPFVAPSVHRVHGFVFREQFYWDSYFTIIALIGTGKHDLGVGMVNNLLHMVERFGYVPNSNNKVHMGRSQPPLLSSMVMMVYDHNKNLEWLKNAYSLIEQEYENVWLSAEHPQERNVYRGLSRYYNENRTHQGAEDESGWDYTSRFEDRALDILPIDLNCFLFKYEEDLAEIAGLIGQKESSKKWRKKAESRKKTINQLMWNESEGIFNDYDYRRESRTGSWSLATFVPLFVGLATKQQASKLVDKLQYFETEFGLSTTPKDHAPIEGKQWAAPNGWAPLHHLVVEGLENYGYRVEASRIANKWLKIVNEKFIKSGLVYEKYNVINPDLPPTSAVYPDQYGFAWSNGVTYSFIKQYC